VRTDAASGARGALELAAPPLAAARGEGREAERSSSCHLYVLCVLCMMDGWGAGASIGPELTLADRGERPSSVEEGSVEAARRCKKEGQRFPAGEAIGAGCHCYCVWGGEWK